MYAGNRCNAEAIFQEKVWGDGQHRVSSSHRIEQKMYIVSRVVGDLVRSSRSEAPRLVSLSVGLGQKSKSLSIVDQRLVRNTRHGPVVRLP